jgi:hypothetical protein
MRKQADALKVCPIPDACLLVMAQRPYRLLGSPETRSLIFLIIKNSPDQVEGYLDCLQPQPCCAASQDITRSQPWTAPSPPVGSPLTPRHYPPSAVDHRESPLQNRHSRRPPLTVHSPSLDFTRMYIVSRAQETMPYAI